MQPSMAIWGGEVAGLKAAHKPGFPVRVYEPTLGLGGNKPARFCGSAGLGGRADLPAAHAYGANGKVFDNLIHRQPHSASTRW